MEPKAWYSSNGVRGSLAVILVGVVVGISGVVGMFKGDTVMPPATFDTLGQVQEIVQQEESSAAELITAVLTVIGGSVGLYGRIRAQTQIQWAKPKPKVEVPKP